MKVANINASEHLLERIEDTRVLDFILDVVRPLEFIYNHSLYHQIIWSHHSHFKSLPLLPIWKFEKRGYENIISLLHTIPIYFCDSRPKEIRGEDSIVEDSIIDVMGAYHSNRKGYTPYIELYLTDIDGAAQNNDIHFKWLVTKVLIHELAHAALDIFNWEHNRCSVENVSYHTKFGRWREESMANAITLKIIKDCGHRDFYDYAKHFMLSQPAEYALGVLMEDVGYWDFRSVFDSKMQGVDHTLQAEWLKYASGNPDWAGLKKWNEILDNKYVYLFDGEYYTSAQKVVYSIVGKVLSDYEKDNGAKMPVSTFRSLFPYIKTGVGMSYEPIEAISDFSRYQYKIELAEGDYALCDTWHNETLHKFIVNVKSLLTQYQNY